MNTIPNPEIRYAQSELRDQSITPEFVGQKLVTLNENRAYGPDFLPENPCMTH